MLPKQHPVHLRAWEEAVGILDDVRHQEKHIYATLADVGTVVFPFHEDHYQKLLELEGTRVAILRTTDGYAVGEAV